MMTKIVVVSRVAVKWVDRVPSDEWLTRRLVIMRSVVCRSLEMAIDSGVDLTWVWLACDERVDRLRHESENLDYVTVVEQGALTIPVDADRVVAIRIDSDDVIDPTLCVELYHDPPEEGELVEIMQGYQLDARSGEMGRFTMRTRPPPIFAIGRSRDDAIDVDRYHAWRRRARRRQRSDRHGSFIQIVGHGNVLNKWRVESSDALEDDEIRDVLTRYGIDAAVVRTGLSLNQENNISGTL